MIKKQLPGDIIFERCHLTTPNGSAPLNITPQILNLDIYESLLLPFNYCEVRINDGINMLADFPIIGEETLEIAFYSPGVEEVTSFKFMITQVVDIRVAGNNKTKQYILRGVSEQLMTNAKTFINQKFEAEISAMVNEVIPKYLNYEKPLYVEETKGIRNYIVSQQKPFEALDKMRRQAVSKSHTGGAFVFCETSREVIFASLEDLFERNKNGVNDRIFFFDTTTNVDFSSMSEKSIIAFENIGMFNAGARVATGGLNTATRVFDMHTKSWKELPSENKGAGQYKNPNDNAESLNTSNWFSKYGDKPGAYRSLVVDSSRPVNTVQDIYSSSRGFISDIVSNMVNVEVYGDSSVTVGDIIGLQIPIMQYDNSRKFELDPLISGKYIVSKLRHMIDFNARTHYRQSYQCLKGAYGESTI